MQFKFTTTVLTASLISGAFASYALAHGDLGDLMVYDDNGKIITGHYDFDGGTALVTDPGPTYVYVTELEDNFDGGGTPGVDEPGYVTDGSAPADPDGQNYLFPGNTALSVTANVLPILGVNVAYWDGTGAVSFGASPHTMMIEGAFDSITLDGSSVNPTGSLNPWISDANGFAHGHLGYLLDEPDATASAGVYLFSVTLDASGLDAADPIYFVAGYGLPEPQIDDATELAEQWVETNLVPEPSTILLAAVGLTLVPARRQRR